ncbi:MAG: hypothetical protein K2X49_10935 [Acetobacteraceae bacterium]|nr:hypothetical protein [Acetobacteraceae bacterium]
MNTDSLVFWLFAFTLLAAVAIGIWQFMRVRRAKRMNTHSAMTTPGTDR